MEKLINLLEDNGFYGNEIEDLMEYREIELVKKSYGDSDESLTSTEFGADYDKLIKLASEHGIRVPEYVYYD